MYYKKTTKAKKDIMNHELHALRLASFRNFFEKASVSKVTQYLSIKKVRDIIIKIDTEELSLKYVHKNLGEPTNRQVFDIHHAVFKDSKMQATQKIIEDYFMNLDVNIDNVSNGKNVNRITKLLRDQGIELKEDTVRKKMRAYQKSLSYISIRSDFQKQKIYYKNLLNELDLAEKQNRTRYKKDYFNMKMKLISQLDKLGSQALGQQIAREEGTGLDLEDLPFFDD